MRLNWKTRAAVALGLLGAVGAVRAEDRYWNNSAGGDWMAASNWNPANRPDAADESAVVSLAGSYGIELGESVSIGSLKMNNPGVWLTLAGVGSDPTLSAGSFELAAGTVSMSGTAGLAVADGGAFSNAGRIEVLYGGGGPRVISGGTLHNTGLIEVTGALTFAVHQFDLDGGILFADGASMHGDAEAHVVAGGKMVTEYNSHLEFGLIAVGDGGLVFAKDGSEIAAIAEHQTPGKIGPAHDAAGDIVVSAGGELRLMAGSIRAERIIDIQGGALLAGWGMVTTTNISNDGVVHADGPLVIDSALTNGGQIIVDAGGTLQISGTLTNVGVIAASHIQSEGTLSQLFGEATIGLLDGEGRVNVAAGQSLSVGVMKQRALVMGKNSRERISANRDDEASRVYELTLGEGARLDIGRGAMVVHSSEGEVESQLAMITGLIASGRNLGAWDGAGINSSTAAGFAGGLTGIGVIVNVNGQGEALYPDFHWETVDIHSILIWYTWNGDADLNGVVDADDYFQIDNGFAQHAVGWRNGDFDYSGAVDADDYFLIDHSFAEQGGGLGVAQGVNVPEPGLVLGVIAIGMVGRRRRQAE